jgi:hypothetical protein
LASRSRKNKDGTVKPWRRSGSLPNIPEYNVARIAAEQKEFKDFKNEMDRKGLVPGGIE